MSDTKPVKQRNSVTISCKQKIGDSFINHTEVLGIPFSAWAKGHLIEAMKREQKEALATLRA